MPVIKVEMWEGRTLEQKRELVEVLTKEKLVNLIKDIKNDDSLNIEDELIEELVDLRKQVLVVACLFCKMVIGFLLYLAKSYFSVLLRQGFINRVNLNRTALSLCL